MMKISNVKAIRFSVAFNGNGCVNWDSVDQKETLQNCSLIEGTAYNNEMYAKKEFCYDKNGEIGFKYKVSSECLRHTIFRKSIPFTPLYENSNDKMRAHPDYIIRGYMVTRGKGITALKRKSPFTITDAVESTDNLHKFADLDLHSNAGDKDNTSLYFLENVGSMEYIAECNLDVEELSFISCDPKYDRQAFDNESKGKSENPYIIALSNTMVNFTPEIKRYSLDNDIFQMTEEKDQRGEVGILLNKESVDMLIHRLFNLIKDVNIYKRNALFEFKEFISIKVITENGIININPEDIEDCIFEYSEAYKEVH